MGDQGLSLLQVTVIVSRCHCCAGTARGDAAQLSLTLSTAPSGENWGKLEREVLLQCHLLVAKRRWLIADDPAPKAQN